MAINFFSHKIKFQLKNKTSRKTRIELVIKKESPSHREAVPSGRQGFGMGNINFIFCDDEFLFEINRKYLEHDTRTDIITFDYSSNNYFSADIFISIPRVKENALKYKVRFSEELNRVMIHGILHLCGYNDKSKKEKVLMRKKEDYYLSFLKP